ncbi:sugar ABC transporter ATP-binding protein [Streptomyces sp. NPDC050619]|uniref:sugar ABC transporter ATP-binding protein n=1 Tax=Streptomyces sp. NPDC050619 TaxID=3157214 RepID=UPI00343F2C5A
MNSGDEQVRPAPLLRAEGITKRFGSAVVLRDANVEFHAGTVTALTGENGSGKSTIARILGGMLAPDAGRILVDGKPARIPDAKTALSHGIALISQELTLAADLTVAENVFLGRLPVSGRVAVSWRRLRSAVAELLETYGMTIDPRARVGDLSIELQQQVEIARALATHPRVLILDEATSSLSEKAADRLLELVEQRRTLGTAVVMITHRMNEIYRAATSAAVLRDGRIMATVPIPRTPEEDLVRLMVGRELGDYYGRRGHELDGADTVLSAVGLSARAQGLRSVDLSVRAGEIVGVAGLSGSGKEALGHALAGAVPAEGRVRAAGRAIRLGRPGAVLRGGLGFVPEDRKAKALLPERSVTENLSVAWPQHVFRYGIRRPRAESGRVADAVRRYGIRTASPHLPVRALSGGNQQKITIGRLFDLNLPVYVLSEPTRGIDVGSRSAIYALLREQTARGAGVLFISSELNELCGVCDRVLVMYRGEAVAEFSGADINEETINRAMVTGSPQPEAV